MVAWVEAKKRFKIVASPGVILGQFHIGKDLRRYNNFSNCSFIGKNINLHVNFKKTQIGQS